MLAAMHLLTRKAFSVSFEWRRLMQLCVVIGGLAALGDVLLPTHGAVGFISRALVWIVIPLALLGTGFAHERELGTVRTVIARVRRVPAAPAGGG
jgi:hypothetical protein